jgi:hypothetical protein
VDSLDQLYTQAMCLEPILLQLVRRLALSHGGYFPADVGGRVQYVRYDEAEARAEAGGECKFIWGRLKSVARAVEKVVRIYDQVRCFARDIAGHVWGGTRRARFSRARRRDSGIGPRAFDRERSLDAVG